MHAFIRKPVLLIIFLLALAMPGLAQTSELHISGSVLDANSLQPLQRATIVNAQSRESVTTSQEGFFKIQVKAGDTLLIRHRLYREARYAVPATLQRSQYALLQLMQQGSVAQNQKQPGFPTQQQFEQALLQMDSMALVNRTAALNENLQQVTFDPTRMQKYLNEHMSPSQYLYEMPASPTGVPNNLLNPERWSNFIKDWREGRFTQQGMEKLEGFPGELKDE